MKLITTILALLLLNSNIVAAENQRQYIKFANDNATQNHTISNELENIKTHLQSITPIPSSLGDYSLRVTNNDGDQIFNRDTSFDDIVGTYILNDGSDSSTLIMDIIDARIEDGSGEVEFALSDTEGFIVEHSLAVLLNKRLIFQRLFLNGGQYYIFNLEPTENGNYEGGTIIEFTSTDCFDESGDGVIELNEFYTCKFTKPIIRSSFTNLIRLN